MSYVWRWTRRAPGPGHDVASPGFHVNLFEATVRGEAGFGGGNVAAHSGPIQEEPAT